MTPALDIIIYHNPRCGTSRTVVEMTRAAGFEPHIIEYLKTPPSATMLLLLAVRAQCSVRDFLRQKEPAYEKYGLDNADMHEEDVARLMHEHPELINRPIMVTPYGVRLCRPAVLAADLFVDMKQDD